MPILLSVSRLRCGCCPNLLVRNISVCRCLSLSLPVNISTSVAVSAMCYNRMCRRISTDLLFQCMQHGQSLLTRFSASWRNFTTIGWSSGNMIWVGHVGAACFRRATISLHIRTTKFYIISTLHQFRISLRHLTSSPQGVNKGWDHALEISHRRRLRN